MLKVLVGLLFIPLSQVQSRELSYPQRMYATGLLCFEKGEVSNGQNAWTKFRAFCRFSPVDCDPAERQKVEDYFLARKAERVEKTEETKVLTATEVTAPPPPPVETKKVPKPRASKAQAPSRPADPSKLVKEAERAREQGQLEAALRYYELAEKINPNTEEFKGPIAELRKLME